MASCATCNQLILFGGKKWEGKRYCNAECLEKAQLLSASTRLDPLLVAAMVRELHQGRCPECKGKGPVDIYESHLVWSAVVMTQWKSSRHLCCRGCARVHQGIAAGMSALVGWWGIPYGLVMTPIQLARNLGAFIRSPDPNDPSPELVEAAKVELISRMERGQPLPGTPVAEVEDAEEPLLLDAPVEPPIEEVDDYLVAADQEPVQSPVTRPGNRQRPQQQVDDDFQDDPFNEEPSSGGTVVVFGCIGLALFLAVGTGVWLVNRGQNRGGHQGPVARPDDNRPAATQSASSGDDDYSSSWSLEVEGTPITAETRLLRGQYVQISDGDDSWYSARVMDTLADGRVWAHKVSSSHHYDDYPVERSELRLAPDDVPLNQPLPAEELDGLYADLTSGDEDRASDACELLTERWPHEPHADIAAALGIIATEDGHDAQDDAAEALIMWSTEESIPLLLDLCDSGEKRLERGGCLALTRWKTPAAIEKVASLIPVGSTQRYYASPALRFMGPDAEPVAIEMLDHENYKARRDACLALKVIGTEVALPRLRQLIDDEDSAASNAKETIEVIEKRIGFN